MGSSSEDSFSVWTEASDDDSMASNDNEENYDYESESGKKFKKKLQKQLFGVDDNVEDTGAETHKQSKKRKIKQENDTLLNNVKSEPESDLDVIKKKKKKSRHKDSENNHENSETQDSYDESFLNMKVKEEKATFATPNPVKKKKSRKSSLANNEYTVEEAHIFTEQELQDSDLTNSVKRDSSESNTANKKKKSKQKSREDEVKEYKVIEEKFSAEETIVETRTNNTNSTSNKFDTEKVKRLKPSSSTNHLDKHHSNSYASKEFISDDSCSDDDNALINNIDTGKPCIPSSTFIDISTQEKVNGHNDQLEKNHHVPQLSNKKSRRKSRISDRIAFEDEEKSSNEGSDTPSSHTTEQISSRIPDHLQFEHELDSEADDNHPSNNDSSSNKHSSVMKHYLKKHSNLVAISPKFEKDSVATNDDDLWIVNCPRDIDIESLEATEFPITNKFKLKVAGQTYDGIVCESMQRSCVSSLEHNAFILQNILPQGVINIRKRLPKPHFVEDNTMVNNQTNFIPLPETKCRHPLLGPHYKQAMKIPAAVAERLRGMDNVENISKKKKKKYKMEPVPAAATNEFSEGRSERGNRKRKHAADEQVPPKKSKKPQYSSEAAETWDSAKAIEDNLFNF